MLLPLLPLLGLAVATSSPAIAAADPVMSPRIAQVRLAETLASADAIDWVRVTGPTITFAIDRDGEALRVVAQTGVRGAVIALSITPSGTASIETGHLGWLASELTDVAAVTNLVVNDDSAIVIVTNDDRHYLTLPGRGPNIALEARWAAAWDTDVAE